MAVRPQLSALLAAAAFAFMAAEPRPAAAQQYPEKPITIVVGFAAGGFVDVMSRLVAHRLSERLGQPVVVENRTGAGGNIAHRTVARAAPDGYTLLAATTSLAINDALYKDRGYETSDLRAITISVSTPEFLANHPSRPQRTLKEAVEAAKAKPVNFGTAGAGVGSHIATEYFFRQLAKVPATHVPFKGGAPALTAALGDQIDLLAVAMAGGVVPPVQQGRLRGLAVASEKRVAVLPDVPTYSEAGYPGFTAHAWAGFFAPAKTEQKIIVKLNAAIDEIMKEPEVLGKLQPLGFDPIYGSQPQAEKRFKEELERWGRMVRSIGLSIGQ